MINHMVTDTDWLLINDAVPSKKISKAIPLPSRCQGGEEL
jgi:hypothetical protein